VFGYQEREIGRDMRPKGEGVTWRYHQRGRDYNPYLLSLLGLPSGFIRPVDPSAVITSSMVFGSTKFSKKRYATTLTPGNRERPSPWSLSLGLKLT